VCFQEIKYVAFIQCPFKLQKASTVQIHHPSLYCYPDSTGDLPIIPKVLTTKASINGSANQIDGRRLTVPMGDADDVVLRSI